MFKEYFILLLLAHSLGDYYLQSQALSERKEKEIRAVLTHSLIYGGAIMCIALLGFSVKVACVFFVYACSHLAIDVCKYWYNAVLIKNKRRTVLKERNLFMVDQLAHGCCMVVACVVLALWNKDFMLWSPVTHFFQVIGVPGIKAFAWISCILLLHKPSNIAIAKLLAIYRPDDKGISIKSDRNTGRLIGTLERLLILIFICINQYSAIGLVLTAKSIARYDKISKEKDFAEYYLLGTLLSTLLVIICSFILSK